MPDPLSLAPLWKNRLVGPKDFFRWERPFREFSIFRTAKFVSPGTWSCFVWLALYRSCFVFSKVTSTMKTSVWTTRLRSWDAQINQQEHDRLIFQRVRITSRKEQTKIGHLQKQETAKKYQTFLNEILTVSMIKRNGMIAVKKKLCAQAAIHHRSFA